MNGRPLLLLVDDDEVHCRVLGRALERRGFSVLAVGSGEAAVEAASRRPPDYAVVDLKLPGMSGLEVVTKLKALRPELPLVVLTGYASIATAVEAVKRGATQYLPKPATANEVLAALGQGATRPEVAVPAEPLSVDRLEWEHIQRVLADHGGNISATARVLKMHRRTLQRKLAKKPAPR